MRWSFKTNGMNCSWHYLRNNENNCQEEPEVEPLTLPSMDDCSTNCSTATPTISVIKLIKMNECDAFIDWFVGSSYRSVRRRWVSTSWRLSKQQINGRSSKWAQNSDSCRPTALILKRQLLSVKHSSLICRGTAVRVTHLKRRHNGVML